MPTLNWIGKEQIINHHNDVPFRVLERKYTFGEIGNEKLGIRNVDDSGDQISNSSFQFSNSKIIHGDNLEALKALLPEYEGRIKCIYIDPPYNTGNENWVYNDNVNSPKIRKWLGQVVGKESEDLSRHDKWLCMMYPRLVLLQKLLSDDGAIFISIDDNEQANLKLICDEIFGGNNFVGIITWESTTQPTNVGNAKFNLQKKAEFVFLYKNGKKQFLVDILDDVSKKYPHNGKLGKCRFEIIEKSDAGGYNRETMKFPILGKLPRSGKRWQIGRETADELVLNNRIEIVDGIVKRAIYPEDEIDKNKYVPFWSHFTSKIGTALSGKDDLNKIMEKAVGFDTVKPVSLIEELISHFPKSSIILDSFAGSGTTAHAVLNLNKSDGGNRKFILVEMEDYAETITAERVKRVIDGYGDTEGTGGSFDFYELGEPVFDADGNLNETIATEKIREYIWYSEIRNEKLGIRNEDDCDSQISNSSFQISNSQYFLGKYLGTAYYFYYEKDQITTLDKVFLNTITQRAEQYVIYADNCLLSAEFMQANHIIFKKIPRDIKKL